MTSDSSISYHELAEEISKFHSEHINSLLCSDSQSEELNKLALTPPNNFTVYKDGSRSLVGKTLLSDGTECVLKYYNPKNLAKKINYRLRGSRAMRSWVSARAFDLLDIPTPSAMILSEKSGVTKLTLEQSFLACHLAPGIPLSAVKDQEMIHHVASQLRDAFAIMADYRICHGDLKANNIIVSDDGKIRFIDLDGVTILSQPKKWAKLWARDRARFLKNWSTESPAHQIFSETINPT